MIAGWIAADPVAVATLAGVTLLEGVRRIPEGGIVLRRIGSGPWRASVADRSALSLVSWWEPCSTVLVLSPGPAAASHADLAAAWRRVRWHVRALAALGALVLSGLVIGVPELTARFGGAGLLGALGVLLLLSLLSALLGWLALRRLGVPGGAALRRSVAWCSPFGAPQAYRQVLEQLAGGTAPLAAARWLMGDAAFAAWIRPRAWDALGGAADAELAALYDADGLRALVDRPPDGDPSAAAWCPRCGTSWRATGACPDCGVGLAVSPRPAPAP